jgi:3-oxoacyl-[acyl-carrier-protein] synthase-1
LAWLLIKNGLQDCVVCGGGQEANMYGVASFDGIQSFALREDNDAT